MQVPQQLQQVLKHLMLPLQPLQQALKQQTLQVVHRLLPHLLQMQATPLHPLQEVLLQLLLKPVTPLLLHLMQLPAKLTQQHQQAQQPLKQE